MTLDEFCAIDLAEQQKHLMAEKMAGRNFQQMADEWDVPCHFVWNVFNDTRRLEKSRVERFNQHKKVKEKGDRLAEDLKAQIEAAFPGEAERRAVVVFLAGAVGMDISSWTPGGEIVIQTGLTEDGDGAFVPWTDLD